jgi:5-methyltetrahydropteroyltriglutamate--homocysteine methyltransferase
VSTKTAELESEERLVARVRDCARYVGLERLAISPQCGFSSSDKSNKIMSIERAAKKLALVADVARKVWGD